MKKTNYVFSIPKRLLEDNYLFSLPKWLAWTAPLAFAISFALFFNILGTFFGPVKCSGFKTQKDAQALFVTNKTRYASLDANHDGIACNGI